MIDPIALADTTDPGRLWRAGPHGKSLPSLRHAIARGKQLMMLTGGPGVGKTIGVNLLSEELAEDGMTIARVPVPIRNAVDFRAAVALALGLPAITTRDELVAATADRGRIAIVVDDAQALSDSALAELGAMLHAIPGSVAVLAGRDTLTARIAAPSVVGSLATILPVARTLRPLGETESVLYIAHVLALAGAASDAIPDGTARAIWRASGGVPRVILHLCRRTLESGGHPARAPLRVWAEELDASPIDDDEATERPDVVALPRRRAAAPSRRPWRLALVGAVVFVGGTAAAVVSWHAARQVRAPSAATHTTPAPAPESSGSERSAPLAVTAPEAARGPERSDMSALAPDRHGSVAVAPAAVPPSAPDATPGRRGPSASRSASIPARDAEPPPPAGPDGDRDTSGTDPGAVIDWLLKSPPPPSD